MEWAGSGSEVDIFPGIRDEGVNERISLAVERKLPSSVTEQFFAVSFFIVKTDHHLAAIFGLDSAQHNTLK